MTLRSRRLALFLPLAAVVALGACHDRDSDRSNSDNESDNVAEMSEPFEPDNAALPPAANVAEAPAEPKHAPAPRISEEQQVLDDAAAVGMTARVSRGEGDAAADGTDGSAPASAHSRTAERDGGDEGSGQTPGQIY